MNIKDFTKPLYFVRLDKDFETEAEIIEYDRQRRLRNSSPNARCCAANCSEYHRCKGFCKKGDILVSKLKECPIGIWTLNNK